MYSSHIMAMNAKLLKCISLAIAVCAIGSSCEDAKNTVEDWWHLEFFPIRAETVLFYSGKRVVQENPGGYIIKSSPTSGPVSFAAEEGEQIDFTDLRLFYSLEMSGPYANPSSGRVPEIEHEIKELFRAECPDIVDKWKSLKNGEYDPLVVGTKVIYSTSQLTSMVIRSTTPLYGLPALSPLNDYIEFDGELLHNNDKRPNDYWMDRYTDYIISYDNTLVGKLSQILTIDEYLSYSPFANSRLYFRFTDIPEDLPSETSFILELGFRDGRVIQNTTAPVSFR